MKSIPYIFLLLCCLINVAEAQMPTDAVYMGKNVLCANLSYTNSSWKDYWENTLKRDNLNMGTVSTQSVSLMVAGGLTKRLTAIVGLPYISTHASAGNLLGQKGMQDLSLWLKYKLIKSKGLSLHGVIGGSIPVSRYVPNFLPMSIGLQAKTLTGRLIANYQRTSGVYTTAHASYTYRSTITIDQDAYQFDGNVYNTNQVQVPNAIETGVSLGYLKPAFQTELYIDRFTCVGGDAIRRNDMPFPTNNMQMTSIGWYGKYQPKALGLNARVAQVISGLNVGQSTSYSVGILYLMDYNHKKM